MKPATIPKSLHTVTVIVAVARLLAATAARPMAARDAVASALIALGYAGTPDTYGLADKATAQLARELAVGLKVAA